MSIRIVTDLPLPTDGLRHCAPTTAKRGRKQLYPFDQLEVGHAILAPRDMGRSLNNDDRRIKAIRSAALTWAKNHDPSRRFMTRVIDANTVACWRIA